MNVNYHSKRPCIVKIKHPDIGTNWCLHDGKGWKELCLSFGKETKTWALSKHVGSSIRSICLGEFPIIATGDMALTVAQKKLDELDLTRDAKASGIKPWAMPPTPT